MSGAIGVLKNYIFWYYSVLYLRGSNIIMVNLL